jgi:glutathione peroxidase
MNIYDIPVKTIDGETTTLEKYRGQVMVIVNVASQCAFTPQYRGLESLYRQFKDRGLVVLGFPCNQFNHQEPGTESDIKSFCSLKYDVSFPMFAKIDVNGPNAHPLYQYLKAARPGWFGIHKVGWNFTKFIVDRSGRVVKRFGTIRSPRAVARAVENLL